MDISLPVDLKLWIAELHHTDYERRQRAAQALLGVGEAAVGPLILLLETGTHPVARVRAAELLGQLGVLAALLPLSRVLECELDPDILRATRGALILLEEKPVTQLVDALLPALPSPDSEENRTLALEWLVRFYSRADAKDRQRILATVAKTMAPERHPWQERFQVAWMRLEPSQEAPSPSYVSLPSTPEALVELLTHADYATRTAATAKLANLGEAALEALRQGLRSGSYVVRSRCVEALGRLGHPSALPALLNAWQLHDDLQGEVGRALRNLASALDYAPSLEHVTVLLKLIEVCRVRVPEAAVFAAQALVMLAQTHPGVRYRAALRWLKASTLELFLGVELDPTLVRLGKELERLTEPYKNLPIPAEPAHEIHDLPRPSQKD